MRQSIGGLIQLMKGEFPISLGNSDLIGKFFDSLLEPFDQGAIHEIVRKGDETLSWFNG